MGTGPLDGSRGAAAAWPAAREAGRLLTELGADMSASTDAAVSLDSVDVVAPASDEHQDWARSGVADLTGRPGGPSLVPRGQPATFARALSLAIRAAGGVVDDGADLLGMRTGMLDLRRGGDRSANGSARLMRSSDGWLAVNLPRRTDLELVPALVRRAGFDDPWAAVAAWADGVPGREAVERATDLGLAVAQLGEHRAARPWTLTRWSTAAPSGHRTRVVNLGALWAAPLAAHVLHASGAEVVDVDTGRGAATPAAWRIRLQTGHRSVTVDLATRDGRAALRRLLVDADVVLEASRPRALRQLGVDAESIMPDGRPRAWIRITGHPRPAERIAYGDDAAVAGGLVAFDDEGPVFAGDAIADPLSGLVAALLALTSLRAGGGWVGDVAMGAVAAHAASVPSSTPISVNLDKNDLTD
jgi:hypothetical protein